MAQLQNYGAAYDIKMNWVPQGAGSTPILLKKVEGASHHCSDRGGGILSLSSGRGGGTHISYGSSGWPSIVYAIV